MGETHIFFIRHGESIDDVSHGHAGPPDSPLTSHGANQASRLGAYLAGRAASLGPLPHLFCSDFQQARMTAEAIRDAYPCPDAGPSSTAIPPVIEIVQLGELREKQFRQRSLEGLESTAVAAARHGEEEEPFEEVSARAKRFLDAVLLPLLEDLLLSSTRQCVFIVAHGGIHSYVWLQFVRVLRTTLRVPPLSTPGVMRLESVPLDEFLSNAAYHEVILKTEEILPEPPFSVQPTASYIGRALSVAHVTFAAINSVDHLSGLKKTGGGIGNSKFDKKQRKIDSFFSPRKRKPDSPGEGSTK